MRRAAWRPLPLLLSVLACTSDPNALVIEGPRLVTVPQAPPYPPLARAAGIKGEVILKGSVAPAGEPFGLHQVSGPRQLALCALQYANSWRFEPMPDKPPRPVELRIRFAFQDKPEPRQGWIIGEALKPPPLTSGIGADPSGK